MGYTSTSQGYAFFGDSVSAGTVAQAFNSLAIGQYNTVDTNNKQE